MAVWIALGVVAIALAVVFIALSQSREEDGKGDDDAN